MKRITVLISMVLLGAVVLYYVNYWDTLPERLQQPDTKLFGDFADKQKALTAIEITNHDGVVLRANLRDGAWTASHLSDDFTFPLNERNVYQLISDIASAQIEAEKTNKPENYPQLHLRDIGQPDALSHRILFETSEKVWNVLVGKQSEHRTGTFVRLPGSRQVLLIDKDIRLPDTRQAWLTQSLFNISQQDIKSINVVNESSTQYQRTEDGQWPIDENFIQTLVELSFTDVLPRNSVLLNWFTQAPSQSITVATASDEWTYSVYENEESQQVWLTLDNGGDEWQENWAFNLSDNAGEVLLKAPALTSEVQMPTNQ